MHRRALIIALLALAGCVSAEQVERRRLAFLGSFVGQSDTDLIQRMGVPSRTYETAGHKFLAYDENSSETLPGDAFMGVPYEMDTGRCIVTFDVVAGKVQAFTQRGTAC